MPTCARSHVGAFLATMLRAAFGADRVRLMVALFAVARSGRGRPRRTCLGENCLDRILVSGVSGPIGTALLSSFDPELEPRGMQIVRLVRRRTQSGAEVAWNPLAPLSPAKVSGFDAVVHLAGESIVGRWTEEKKKAIRESRVQGTRNLGAGLG